MRNAVQWFLAFCLFVLAFVCLAAGRMRETSTVTGSISLLRASGSARTDSDTGIVIWLTPVPNQPVALSTNRSDAVRPKIVQRNKRFETRLLAVQRGTTVEFPNRDPFFHNVFSLFDGKRFDLGLYEAGSPSSVKFDQAGVCYIFCNIHSQMSAVVVVVDTPYFVQLNRAGDFRINELSPGRYQLNVWAERCSAAALKTASRQITVEGPLTTLGAIQLRESQNLVPAHQNKHGRDYDTPVFSSPIYIQP
jgi:plastocyanin